MKHDNILLKSAFILAIVDLALIVATLLQVNNLVKDMVEVQNKQFGIGMMQEKRILTAHKQIKTQKNILRAILEINSDASKWITYKKKEYRFELVYPKEWFLVERKSIFNPASDSLLVISPTNIQEVYPFALPHLIITKTREPVKNPTIEALKMFHGERISRDIITNEQIILNERIAMRIDNKTRGNFEITVMGNDNFYGIHYNPKSKDDYYNNIIFNQIANTFKLTDK